MAPGDKVIKHDLEAELVPDPQNLSDPNAVEVHINGFMVGFLPRDKAEDYSPLIQKARGKGLRVVTIKTKTSYSINKDGEPTPSVSIGILTPKQLSDLLS